MSLTENSVLSHQQAAGSRSSSISHSFTCRHVGVVLTLRKMLTDTAREGAAVTVWEAYARQKQHLVSAPKGPGLLTRQTYNIQAHQLLLAGTVHTFPAGT
jgi:hypothetical protein